MPSQTLAPETANESPASHVAANGVGDLSAPFQRVRGASKFTIGSSANTLLVILLVGVATYRLSLIGPGHFFWADERCYLPAFELLDAIADGEFPRAVWSLFEADGPVPPARPAFVVTSLVPVLLQRIVGSITGVSPTDPAYFKPATAFNVLVSLAITYLVFVLGRSWTRSNTVGLLGALAYSLTVSSNVWIRHMVPYPESTMFFLAALTLICTAPPNTEIRWGRYVLAGLLSAWSYACYPGHYAGVIINGCVAVWGVNQTSSGWHRADWMKAACRSACWFSLGAGAVVIGFEVLARAVGRSYGSDLTTLSGSVSMGDPKEGFVFLWRYLRDVEGPLGLGLLVFFSVGIVSMLRRSDYAETAPPRTAKVALIAAVFCYVAHASMGVFFGRMVFYGRVLLPTLALLVLGSVLGIGMIRRPMLRRGCCLSIIGMVAISFAGFARDYCRVVYPSDFLQASMRRAGRRADPSIHSLWGRFDGSRRGTIQELDSSLILLNDTQPEGSSSYVFVDPHSEVHDSRAEFLAVNVKYLGYVAERHQPAVIPERFVLRDSAPHPENKPYTWYEGRRPWERRRLRERNYEMRVYGPQMPVAP